MKKWIYVSIVVVAALILAVAGWIVQGVRAAVRPTPRPAVAAA